MTADGTKVCIIHKNIPAIISQLTAALSSENINIENMLNKSKKDYAYTMIDTNADVNDKVVSMLTSVEGVIKVRVINK